MSEAIAASKSPGLIRRLSSRATKLAGRRRQSSTQAMSRDHSSGPVIMRRRSDSTNTVPEGGRGAIYAESDEESNWDFSAEPSSYSNDVHDYPSTVNSVASLSTSPAPGPVVPAILLQGTCLTKISKKKKKLLTFVLEKEAAKVSWDKSRPSKSFYIDDITEIRVGSDARNYRQEFGVSEDDESRFFSIVYIVPDKSKAKSQKVMHLIAKDEATFELWTSTLGAMSKHRHDFMQSLSSFHEKAINAYWRREMDRIWGDQSHDRDAEEININGVERLCRSLHIVVSANYIKSVFDRADVTRTGRLNITEFQDFVRIMKRREDIRAIFRELASDRAKGLTMEEFLRFLKDIQHEDMSDLGYWESVFAKFVRRSKTKEQAAQHAADGEEARMNESALSSYLISTTNIPTRSQPAQYTLDRPMNEYFISSSHNTYLLGRQVAGQSSIEAYISALNGGCRCIEVDCWNGSDGPVVMHGRTLTTQVSFKDVMSTISKYAFVKSPYPLWVSLEVHCNPQQQAMMAAIIKETCGSKLVTEPLDSSTEQLPAPSQLMHRILIKVKKPNLSLDNVTSGSATGRRRGSSLNSPYVRPQQLDNSLINASMLPSNSYSQPSSMGLIRRNTHFKNGRGGRESGTSSTSDTESNSDDIAAANDSRSDNPTSNIVKVLGELGVYSAGIKFSGFDHPDSKTYNHIFSFMESTFDKKTSTVEEKRTIMRHNMRYMMRVYPDGWRVGSSNFDPLKYWRRGVQMVALNWQTYDLAMQMNDAMFASGIDQSGYVLKSTDLRTIKMVTSIPEEAGAGHVKRERKAVNFSIDVMSAQQLMRPKDWGRAVSPYVEVEVYHADDKSNVGIVGEGGLDASSKDGSSGLGTPHRRRTHIIQDNGFNPIFDKKLNFNLTTKFPELVFVRFTVRCSSDGTSYSNSDKSNPSMGSYTAKLSGLKQGYRTLPLNDVNGDQFLFSTLFCRIKIDPTTSVYIDSPEPSKESTNVLKSIGRSVWRNSPMSPRTVDPHHQ